jgi:hypothetical protein
MEIGGLLRVASACAAHFGPRAPEGWRNPKRFANFKDRFEPAPAFGVRSRNGGTALLSEWNGDRAVESLKP